MRDRDSQPQRAHVTRRGMLCAALLSLGLLAGTVTACSSAEGLPSTEDGITDIAATTPIIADLARNVAGSRARVTALIPPSADPHTHELSLRDVRNVANADIAFTNGLLLEPQAVQRAVTHSVRPGVPVVAVAEQSESYGAKLLPLVENLSLDSVWLGLRVSSTGSAGSMQATEASEDNITFQVSSVDGPGQASAYITGTFGQPEIFFNSGDGLDPDPLGTDAIELPPRAHTHMTWSFSAPGLYHLTMRTYRHPEGKSPEELAQARITFAVGIPAQGGTVVRNGHHDIQVDVGNTDPANPGAVQARMSISGDALEKKQKDQHEVQHSEQPQPGQSTQRSQDGQHSQLNPEETIIEVPSRTLQQVPAQRQFRFLGEPGQETYVLAQAVLGKHVHGELDPHVWHSVANARAMVEVIRNELSTVDPQGAAEYQRNAQGYLDRLDGLERYVAQTLRRIPDSRRHLITAHDGYAYLGDSYGVDIAGFITPNPAVEPSARDVVALRTTLRNLRVPAVFVEPSLAGQALSLKQLAQDAGVQVCTIRGDTFDEHVHSYEELMRTNATMIAQCLGGQPAS